MSAGKLMYEIGRCQGIDSVIEVTLHAAELATGSHKWGIDYIMRYLNVTEDQAEILLAWGEKNYDIGHNQSF
jgi:hypothetical protein